MLFHEQQIKQRQDEASQAAAARRSSLLDISRSLGVAPAGSTSPVLPCRLQDAEQEAAVQERLRRQEQQILQV